MELKFRCDVRKLIGAKTMGFDPHFEMVYPCFLKGVVSIMLISAIASVVFGKCTMYLLSGLNLRSGILKPTHLGIGARAASEIS